MIDARRLRRPARRRGAPAVLTLPGCWRPGAGVERLLEQTENGRPAVAWRGASRRADVVAGGSPGVRRARRHRGRHGRYQVRPRPAEVVPAAVVPPTVAALDLRLPRVVAASAGERRAAALPAGSASAGCSTFLVVERPGRPDWTRADCQVRNPGPISRIVPEFVPQVVFRNRRTVLNSGTIRG